MVSVYLNESIEPKERVRYRELAKELEEIKESIALLIKRMKWIEEEVFPEMENKISGLVDEKIKEIEYEWRTFQKRMVSHPLRCFPELGSRIGSS